MERDLDKDDSFCALVADLCVAFHSTFNDFSIAKLEAYSSTYEALSVMKSFLSDRTHRT